jgi:hypothetical protein
MVGLEARIWQGMVVLIDQPGMGNDPSILRDLTPQYSEERPAPTQEDAADEPGINPIDLDHAVFTKKLNSLPVRSSGSLGGSCSILRALGDTTAVRSIWRVVRSV